jgi:preprotein translocase subunit YajC
MMIWNSADTLIAQAPAPAPGESLWTMVPFILVFVAMWVIMTGSQRKRAKQHEALIKSIKTGDKVTTSSGIIGIVVNVKDRSVSIRSVDTKLEVLKSAISEITEREGEPSQSPT